MFQGGIAVCGITGWVAYQHDLTAQRQVAETMTETMACRGPDDSGVWLGRHAAMGHRRLAVIDLPGGTQPMTADTAEGAVTLVYSGECYNYTELRAELRRRGHPFRTDSDTEVVLRGYLEWGDAVVDRMNGMFAFAVWDDRSERLLLARDRMGVKPLYYYPTGDGVLFGSEPKAILANPVCERVVDLSGLRELLAFTKTPGEAIWQGMREVEPGTIVIADRAGCRSRTYWALTATEHTDDVPTTVARVRELLDDIVRRQLISDVPRCVLLSGGLDSSAITALAAGQLRNAGGGPLRTFAVDFVGQTENFVPDGMRDTPDAPFVQDVAKHVSTDHHDIMLDVATLADPAARKATVTARDIPAGLGDMDNSLYLLFAAIREHSTVALSGESADEVFGGYRWFHDPGAQRAGTFPWLAMNESRSLATVPVLEPDVERALDLDGYVAWRYREAVAEVPVIDGQDEHEARMRQICYLHLTRFVRMLLDRKDRMSMAVGLEVRVPFCDHRLVDYVFNTPWAFKTFDGREKSLLRAATSDVLPQSVVERVKSPYPSTQDLGYVTELQRQLDGLMHSGGDGSGLFNQATMADIAATDPKAITPGQRAAMERVLDVATWIDACRPELRTG
jgi:asparagine synthase (glutamine-hydrolysing)